MPRMNYTTAEGTASLIPCQRHRNFRKLVLTALMTLQMWMDITIRMQTRVSKFRHFAQTWALGFENAKLRFWVKICVVIMTRMRKS